MAISVNTRSNVIIMPDAIAIETLVTPELIRLKAIYWLNPTTEGHLFNLLDSYGDSVFAMRAEADNGSQMWQIADHAIHGLKCDDLDSGTVYIYFY